DRAGVGGELPAVQNRGVRVGGERQLHVHRGGGALRGADAHRAVLPGGAVVGEVDRAGAARQVGRVDHLVAGAADAVVAGGGGGRRGTQGGEEHRGGGDRGRAGPVRKGHVSRLHGSGLGNRGRGLRSGGLEDPGAGGSAQPAGPVRGRGGLRPGPG